VEEVVVLMMVR